MITDKFKQAIERLGESSAHFAQAMAHLTSLLATPNQPLPEPQKVPLVGDASSPPASEKRPVDAPWIPDELPDSGESGCAENIRDATLPQSEARTIADATPEQRIAAGFALPGDEPDGKMTAREWRNSKHFLQFMKQTEFKQWNAGEQNARGDQFVSHVESKTPDKRMGRWGQQFKIFHGLKARP